MRILLLCAATFVVGLLVGVWLLPEETTPDRAPTRAAPAPERPPPGPSSHTEYAPPSAESVPAVGGLVGEARTEIDRLLRSDRALAVLTGDGVITGTVRDAAGNPLAGVAVTALHDAQPFRLSMASRRARERPHENRVLSEVAGDAIQGELWRREMRRTATTGSDGSFELLGLMDAQHTVTAYHDEYDVRPMSPQGKVVPDAVVDFIARPVVEVAVEVRTPEGELTEYAWLKWQGPHGTGWGAWTKEEGTVRMPPGECKVTAQTSVPVPLQSAEVTWTIPSAGPLVLQLEGRRVLTARLALPEGIVLSKGIDYRLRALAAGETVEPKLLAQSQHKAASSTPTRASWLDLEPGRYVASAFLNKRRLLAYEIVEVGAGPVDVELAVKNLAGATVRLLGPDGGPVPGPASFHVFAGPEGRARYQKLDALRRADGAWLVLLSGVDAGESGQASLRVATKGYGSALQSIDLAVPGTVTIRLGQPALLRVKVQRRDGVRDKMYAALRGDESMAAYAEVSANGDCTFTGVQPGSYHLMLVLARKKTTWSIFREQIRLGSGEAQRTVAVPALHTLRVRVPDKFRGGIRLRCTDQALGEFQRDARVSGRVAVFDALAAGTYELQWADGGSATVRVPSDEVVLE